jgi:protein SCO1/2
MIKNRNVIKFAGLGAIFLMPAFFLLFFESGTHTFYNLPKYGPKTPLENGDTLYYEIPDFSFTNQFGEAYGSAQLENKIIVANFIFTRCPSICPDMTYKMLRLQWKLDDPAFQDLKFISTSVDPEYDTPQVLEKFGRKNDADFDRWNFLTGDRKAIYTFAAEGLFLAASEDVLAPGGFLHSEKCVLIDRNRNIRGFYDGTDFDEIDRLEADLKLLLKEEKVLAREAEENSND